MRKNLTIVFLALALCVPAFAVAAELQFEETYILERNQRLAEDLYSFGERTTIAGTVAGDAIVFGGMVFVEGTVEGDLTAAGGTISITGTVQDDVRVAGGTITISGPITGDLLVAGGEVTLTPSGSVAGDVLVAGGTFTLDGSVRGDLKAAAGTVRINNRVDGSVDARVGEVTLGGSALIGGNFTYSARKAATLEPGAQVRGTTDFTQTIRRDYRARAFFGGAALIKLAMLFGAALVLIYLFRRLTRMVVEHNASHFAKDFLTGFVVAIVAPVAMLLLCFTVIGIPFAIIAFLKYVSMMIVAGLLMPVFLGSWIDQKIAKRATMELSWRTALYGVLALFLIIVVPILGGIACFVVFLSLFGALCRVWKEKFWQNR